MLKKRLMEFQAAERMQQEDFSQLSTVTIRYLLRLATSNEMTQVARAAGVLDNFRDFKKTTLDGTAYALSRYWRAVYIVVRGKNCAFCDAKASCNSRFASKRCTSFVPAINRVALSLDVEPEDISMAINALSAEDKAQIRVAKNYREWPCDSEIATLIKGLTFYARRIASKKLHFIETYAGEWQAGERTKLPSPIESELLAEGYRVALKYDHKLEITKIKTIVMSWMHNYAVNLIKKSCTVSRRNIVRTQHHVSRMGNRDEFGITLCSIDAPSGTTDEFGTECSMHNVLPAIDLLPAIEEGDFVRQIKKKSRCAKCNRFVDIVLGDAQDMEFEAWLASQGLTYDALSLDRISTLAKNFLGVSDKKLERRIGLLLTKQG
jgi:hypothetical protein